MEVGRIYKSKKSDHTVEVLVVGKDKVLCRSVTQYLDRDIWYPRDGFVKSMVSGNYDIVKKNRS